ncbi:MAG: discoidin domain-containing protein [Paludibacteraceae bacterium]|nr:discoidin domain-containing protein [Paludibacteraceae bacterium]
MKKSFAKKILLIAIAGLMTMNVWGQAVPSTVPADPENLNDCQVKAIFGTSTYPNAGVTLIEWDESLNVAEHTQTIAGKNVIEITFTAAHKTMLKFSQIDLTSGGFTHVHFDVWSPVAREFASSILCNEGGYKGENVSHVESLTAETWKSIDFALSSLTDMSDYYDHTEALIVNMNVGATAQTSTLYIANLYFYKSTSDESCYETLNVAQNKPAEAGYEDDNANESASKANDGNAGSLWVTWDNYDTSKEWWYVDLLHNYDINKIEVAWGGDYSTNYILQTRQEAPSASDKADDSKWVTVATVTDATANSTKTSNVTATGRYVRIHSLTRSGNCIRLAELRVFTNGYAAEDTHDPEITTAEVADNSENITSVKLHLLATDEEDGDVITFELNKGDDNWLSFETDASNCYTITDLARGHYSYQVKAVDRAGHMSEISTINFDIFNPADNLAINKTVVAGFEDGNAGEVAGKVTDNNLNSKWIAYGVGTVDREWIYVDLEDYYQISSIELFWEVGRYMSQFDIQVAQQLPVTVDDDTQWYPVSTETHTYTNDELGNTEDKAKSYTVNKPARYIRLRSKAHVDCASIFEFRVFGTGFVSRYSSIPTLSTAEVNSYPSGYRTVKLHLVATDSKGEAIHTYRITDENANVSIVTTDNDDYVIISGLSWNVNHTLTVEAMDPAAQLSLSQDIPVLIWDPTENLAKNKTAVAGFEDTNPGEVAGKVTDNNLDSKWIAYGVGTVEHEWIYVDLEDYYQVSSIELFWEVGRYMSQFDIQVAQQLPTTVDDDTQWYPVSTETHAYTNEELGNTEDKAKSYTVNKPARYIRLRSKAHVDCASIFEFRVFGTGFATADENVPVISTASVSYNNDGKAYITLIASDSEDGAITLFRVVNTTTGTTQLLTTNASNQLVFDDLELVTNYHFEIQAMDKAANLSAISELNVYIPTPTTTNIAPLGTASAGYVLNDGEGPTKANDELENTSWVTYGHNAQSELWWQVELDGVYHLTKIAVLWNDDNYASKYTIKTRVSTNDDWTAQPQVSIDENGLKEMSVDLNAKFVRIEIDEEHTGGFIRMHEVQICGELQTITLNETSNAAIIEAYNNQTMDVALSRSILADGTWYTLCLPFDMSASKVTEVFGNSTIAELKSSEDRGALIHLNFDYVNAMVAGHAYMIKPGQNFVAGTIIEGVTIKNVNPEALKSTCEHMYFQGTFDKTTLTESNQRFVGANNYLYSPNSTNGSAVGAFRCYFTIPDNSAALAPGKRAQIIFAPQTATSISNVQRDDVPCTKVQQDGQLLIIRDGHTYNAQGMLVK